jgi:hypothetical protein
MIKCSVETPSRAQGIYVTQFIEGTLSGEGDIAA